MAEFDLHITFAGLCMLVDDTAGANKRLHVVMPRTTGAHLHAARLKFNLGHYNGLAELPLHGASISLENRKLDLSGLVTRTRLVPNLRQSNVFDLGTFAKVGVDRDLLDLGDDTSAPNASFARVTLAAGKIKRRKKGARWKMDGSGPVHMATSVQFRIEKVKGTALTLNLEPLNRNGTAETVTLKPITGVIRLWVYHSPLGEIPLEIPPLRRAARKPADTHARHVAAFYEVLSPPVPTAKRVTPEFFDVRDEDTLDTEPEEKDERTGRRKGAAAGEERRPEEERPALTTLEAALQAGELVSCIAMGAKPG